MRKESKITKGINTADGSGCRRLSSQILDALDLGLLTTLEPVRDGQLKR